MAVRKIILFELNEVPFRIVDEYRRWEPGSHLARNLPRFRQYETVCEDDVDLSPWITWPTLHRGVNCDRHEIFDFGQDLREVDDRYPPLWKILDRHGVATGVFGSLHTYPVPDDLHHAAFYMPDPFAAGPEALPDVLRSFQEFNLAMSRESSRNVSTSIHWKSALGMAVRMPWLGIRPATLLGVARQLADERSNPWRRVRRRTVQSVLGFDVFLRQLRRTQPSLATFFSNHVASSMHRYWAAAFPGDYERFEYTEQWVERFGGEVRYAMGCADAMLGHLLAFVDAHPEYVLLVASSMGQAATETRKLTSQLYLRDLKALTSRAGLAAGQWERHPAMDPDVSIRVDAQVADEFESFLSSIRIDDKAVAFDRREGDFFHISCGRRDIHDKPHFARVHGERVPYAELGLQFVEIEDQTADNAYHIPEGILLAYDPRSPSPTPERTRISSTELAPALLRNFDVPRPDYMSDGAALAIS